MKWERLERLSSSESAHLAHQANDVLAFQLTEDAFAIDLNRARADSEIASRFLGGSTAIGDAIGHLQFPGREHLTAGEVLDDLHGSLQRTPGVRRDDIHALVLVRGIVRQNQSAVICIVSLF